MHRVCLRWSRDRLSHLRPLVCERWRPLHWGHSNIRLDIYRLSKFFSRPHNWSMSCVVALNAQASIRHCSQTNLSLIAMLCNVCATINHIYVCLLTAKSGNEAVMENTNVTDGRDIVLRVACLVPLIEKSFVHANRSLPPPPSWRK